MKRPVPRRRRRLWTGALAAASCAAIGAPAHAEAATACKLYMSPEGALHVEPGTRRPVVTVKINGRPARALIDTGAASSLLSEDVARRMGLTLRPTALRSGGMGGAFDTYVVDVKLNLAGADTPIRMLAGGRAIDVDLLIGDDLLHMFDVEFDLAHGNIRLMKAQGCRDADMPYWAEGYSEAPLLRPSQDGDDHYVTPVRLNGREVRAYLDSGAETSLATLAAARRAGVAVAASAVTARGRGLGPGQVAISFAPLQSFEIGGERIANTRLTFGDVFAGDTYEETGSHLPQRMAVEDMLLGADFLVAHRVMLSPSHHKMFFTYNGGPVFAPPAAASVSSSPASAGPAPAAPHTGA